MKLALAALVFLVFGVLLGCGILLAVQKSWGLLAAGVALYSLMLWRIGCTVQKQH